jgi:hypothetical protein
MFLDAIHGFDCGGFLADIERFGCGELHFGGKFVTFDSGIQTAVFFALLLVDVVELFQQGKAGAVTGGLDVAAGFVIFLFNIVSFDLFKSINVPVENQT